MMMEQLCAHRMYCCWDSLVLRECTGAGTDLFMVSADVPIVVCVCVCVCLRSKFNF